MEYLIISIVAAILFANNIIDPYVCIGIVIAGAVCMLVGTVLYFKFGFLKIWYHDVLGWHTPDDSPQHSDGCSKHATCKYCGKDIMMDSQGNWF